jgi:D-tyrosyl-tRNA(Tyr) deacylase
MKVLLQRVSQANVSVDGEVIGEIEAGLLLLTGLTKDDDKLKVEKMAEKVLHLRVFKDENGSMNNSILDEGREILVVSQFTLYGDTKKGRRPSFVQAAAPDQAEPLLRYFIDCLKARDLKVECGRFGADMQVALVNDGPMTLMIEL